MDELKLQEWLLDPNAFWVLCGTTLLGLVSGVLGSFAYLRKRGLMGDVLSHAALPGICLAFLVTGSKHPLIFLIGATVTGILASMAISAIVQNSRIKEDTALGLVLSVFFGIGIVLLTQIQHSNYGNQSGLDKFLFGQAASMIKSDIQVMGTVAVILLVLCFLFFKELKLLCFDASFANSLGFPVKKLDFLLMLFLVMTVVIGLQAAGVVLMAALLITPAASARYWTEKLDTMVILSGFMGALCGVLGTVISSLGYHLSTGPLIVLAATFLFLFSMIFAPKRGLLKKWIRFVQTKRNVEREQFLLYLYEWMEQEPNRSLSWKSVMERFPSSVPAQKILRRLEKEKLIRIQHEGVEKWISFTKEGMAQAYETVLFHRMMEVWQMHEGELPSMIPQNEIEMRKIPDALVPKLMQLLERHRFMPHPFHELGEHGGRAEG